MFQHIGEIIVLFWRTLQALPLCWRQRRKIFEQLFEIGNVSLLMVCILSLFIAGVTALQTGPVMVEHGLGTFVGEASASLSAKNLLRSLWHSDCRTHRFGHGRGNRLDAGLSGN